MNLDELTPIQRKIYLVLEDGRLHTKFELLSCLDDEVGTFDAVKVHISRLREKLKPRGLGILLDRANDIIQYRLVQHVAIATGPNS